MPVVAPYSDDADAAPPTDGQYADPDALQRLAEIKAAAHESANNLTQIETESRPNDALNSAVHEPSTAPLDDASTVPHDPDHVVDMNAADMDAAPALSDAPATVSNEEDAAPVVVALDPAVIAYTCADVPFSGDVRPDQEVSLMPAPDAANEDSNAPLASDDPFGEPNGSDAVPAPDNQQHPVETTDEPAIASGSTPETVTDAVALERALPESQDLLGDSEPQDLLADAEPKATDAPEPVATDGEEDVALDLSAVPLPPEDDEEREATELYLAQLAQLSASHDADDWEKVEEDIHPNDVPMPQSTGSLFRDLDDDGQDFGSEILNRPATPPVELYYARPEPDLKPLQRTQLQAAEVMVPATHIDLADLDHAALVARCRALQMQLDQQHAVHEEQVDALAQAHRAALRQQLSGSRALLSRSVSFQNLPMTLTKALSCTSIEDALEVIRTGDDDTTAPPVQLPVAAKRGLGGSQAQLARGSQAHLARPAPIAQRAEPGDDDDGMVGRVDVEKVRLEEDLNAMKKENDRLLEYLQVLLARIMDTPSAMSVLATPPPFKRG
ncbi:hypothetical protein AMAG_15519 [Allomyces macrogynus ATCC 38327]|uniref:FIP-RBD domain-containing protein n=1 Tax=Allomyces macrogynus (strain ATCC 38327) TaxID=578462 RepID=A0A0L0T8Y6_ALLM3|nr:hypothetical protein AMAG_15519 [Allomyces macrogynus ATCC 38327]|eukprot:KNE71278.1 hypothetical protein AMAG_15519 [Allomyces macrogynus ATCC 38327]